MKYIVEILLVAILVFCIIYSIAYSLTYPEFFGIVKPISIIQYSGFLLFALVLNNLYEKYKPWFTENKSNLIVIGMFFLMATLYEAVWTFQYWFSLYGIYGLETDIDEIDFHPMEGRISYPYNMNVNSKHFWLWAFCSLYFVLKVSDLV